jgi:Holliday junction resolvase RusA-like endonuclease
MIKFTLDVIPRTKKNSQQIIFTKGRRIIIPSKQYQKFETECLKQIEDKYRQTIDYPVNVKATFYMQTRRRVDLTNLLEALDDVLVKAEVLEDDCRDIIASHNNSIVLYDKDMPRIEVEIEKVKGEYEVWKNK